jgi:hypothetical protein
MRRRGLAGALVAALLAAAGCGDDAPRLRLTVVTFNTGSGLELDHDALPDDGYGSAQAALTDQYYGNGLAWVALVEETRQFFATTAADLVAFQEIFYSGDCPDIPPEAWPGFVCETWQPGDPTVAQVVVGEGWQVACNRGKPDKCLAIRRTVGSFRGCDADLCLDGLDGAEVDGCGKGSRIGRGVVDLVAGGSITVVNVHGSSGLAPADMDCRARQFALVFEDLGDGAPAANGERNLILGDFNTDPGRAADYDPSAAFVASHVGPGTPLHFITAEGLDAPPTYAGLFNIDHVISDAFRGSCWAAGVTEGHPPVTRTVFFDHVPQVCQVEAR